MAEIPLDKGKIALVDDFNYWRVMEITWHAVEKNGIWYARHTFKYPNIKFGQKMYMHSFILDTTNSIDHRNCDGLNNLESNLRLATKSQNAMNAKKRKGTASRFKGVYPKRGKWGARITLNQHTTYLGYFDTEEEAALAYNRAAIIAFGEFARLNELGDCIASV